MRSAPALILIVTLALATAVAGAEKKPPRTLSFPSKAGDITFTHRKHANREKGNCATCHDKLWPKSARVAPESSAGCKTCHHADGRSFEMKGNCARCHAAKTGQ